MTDSTDEATAVDLDDFGLFDPTVQQCPHAYYAQMREQAPVYPAALYPPPGSARTE